MHSEAIKESVEDYEYLSLLRDKAATLRAQGGEAAAKADELERVLKDGVQRVLKEVDGYEGWCHERDCDLPDRVRIVILKLLESRD